MRDRQPEAMREKTDPSTDDDQMHPKVPGEQSVERMKNHDRNEVGESGEATEI